MPKPQSFPSAFLPGDGYTEQGFIRGVANMHPDIHFKFRPVPVVIRGQIFSATETLPDDGKKFAHQAECLVTGKYLLEWDIIDHRAKPVALTSANLLALKPRVFFTLVAIVMGNEASDSDGAAPHLANQSTEDLVALSLAGSHESAETIREKNSVAG